MGCSYSACLGRLSAPQQHHRSRSSPAPDAHPPDLLGDPRRHPQPNYHAPPRPPRRHPQPEYHAPPQPPRWHPQPEYHAPPRPPSCRVPVPNFGEWDGKDSIPYMPHEQLLAGKPTVGGMCERIKSMSAYAGGKPTATTKSRPKGS